jgi:hypothetical protein
METEGSLPHSQKHATCPYPKRDRSSPFATSHFSKIRFKIIFSKPLFSEWLPSLRFFHQNFISSSATYFRKPLNLRYSLNRASEFHNRTKQQAKL